MKVFGVNDTPWVPMKKADKRRISLNNPMYVKENTAPDQSIIVIDDDEEVVAADAVKDSHKQCNVTHNQLGFNPDIRTKMTSTASTSKAPLPDTPRRFSRKRSADDSDHIEILATRKDRIEKKFVNGMGEHTISIPSSQRTTPESDISTAVVPTARTSLKEQSPAVEPGPFVLPYHRQCADSEFKEALGHWGEYAVRLFLSDIFPPSAKKSKVDIPNEKELFSTSKVFWKNRKVKITKRGIMINQDFAEGKEPRKLKVYDSTGDMKPLIADANFEYVASNCLDKFNQTLNKEDFTLCCDCKDGCGLDCACVSNSIEHGSAFIHDKYILVRDKNFWNSVVFACGPECKCRGTCTNSMPDTAKDIPLELFRDDKDMGFAVRTKRDILPGEAVFQFAGDTVDSGEVNENYSWCIFDRADSKQDDGYVSILEKVFKRDDLLPKRADVGPGGYQIHIDPFKRGNMGRFASHSEYPNTLPIRLFQNDLRPEMTKLMFIASRPIPAGAQVFADYGAGYAGFDRCLCGGMGCGRSGDFLRLSKEYTATKVMINELFAHSKDFEVTYRRPKIETDLDEIHLRTKLRALRNPAKLNVPKIIKEIVDLIREREKTIKEKGSLADELIPDDEEENDDDTDETNDDEEEEEENQDDEDNDDVIVIDDDEDDVDAEEGQDDEDIVIIDD